MDTQVRRHRYIITAGRSGVLLVNKQSYPPHPVKLS
jgi:hypothetical protein